MRTKPNSVGRHTSKDVRNPDGIKESINALILPQQNSCYLRIFKVFSSKQQNNYDYQNLEAKIEIITSLAK